MAENNSTLALDPPTEGTVETTTRPARRRAVRRSAIGHFATPLVFAILLVPVFGGWLGSTFLTIDARLFDGHQNAPVLLIAIGLVPVMATHNFDLSVASLATLTAILVLGLRIKQGMPFWLVLLICLGVAIAAGLLNGVLVTVVKLNAFIATLGTGALFVGLAAVYTGGQHVNAAGSDDAPPSWFTGLDSLGSSLRSAPALVVWLLVAALAVAAALVLLERTEPEARGIRIGGVVTVCVVAVAFGVVLAGELSWMSAILVIVALAVWVLIRYTVSGRYLFAVGGNPTAARLAGVKVDRLVLGAFVSASVMAGLAGVALASTQGSAAPGLGEAFLLPAYSAIFLGAVMFSAGRYHVWGTLLGGICVIWVAQGLITGGVPYTWTEFINGAVLILAVAVSSLLAVRKI